MKKLIRIVVCMLLPMAAQAEPVVEIVTLQKGVFEQPACEEEGDVCLTECKITYPVVSGLTNIARQKTLNALWEKKAQDQVCEGKKIAVGLTDDRHPNERSIEFSTFYSDDKLLVLHEERYEHYSGAAHGMYSTNGTMIDLATSRKLSSTDIIAPKDYVALNAYMIDTFKEDDRLFDDVRGDKKAVFISEDKQEFTLLFDEKQGLFALFPLYAIGSYASGEIDIAIPSQFIIHPHIKKQVEALEYKNAAR